MRNRYKGDINRLIEFPRRRAVPRKMFSPGRLPGAVSSVLFPKHDPYTPLVEGGFSFLPAYVYGDLSMSTYGEPLMDNGLPVNPPLGTVNGTSPRWGITPDLAAGGYNIQKSVAPDAAGNRNWIGGHVASYTGPILSWEGPPTRMYDDHKEASYSPRSPWHDSWSRGTVVYYKLEKAIDLVTKPLDGYQWVCGASIRSVGPVDYLYVVASTASSGINQAYRIYRWPFNLETLELGTEELQATFSAPANCHALTDFYFNADGDRAVCTFRNQKVLTEEPQSNSLVYKIEYEAATNSIVSTLVWDRYAAKNWTYQQVTDKTYTIRRVNNGGVCGERLLGPSLIEHIQISRDTNQLESNKPLYIEYVGNEQITVFYRTPLWLQTDRFDYKLSEITKQYPNPCAGQPGEPDLVNRTFAKENIRTIDLANGPQSPRQIVTSTGQILAEEKYRHHQDSNYSYLYESEIGSLSGCNNTYQYNEQAYSFTYTQSHITGGWEFDYTADGRMMIDARFGFCSLYEYYYGEVLSATLSGVNPINDAVYSGGQYRLVAPLTGVQNFQQTLVRTFKNGVLVDEKELARQDFSITTKSFAQNPYWEEGLTGLTATLCDDVVTDQAVISSDGYDGPLFIPASRQSYLEGASLTIGGRTATSVLCIDGSGGPHLYQALDGITGGLSDGLLERPAGDPYLMHRLTVY